MRVLEQNLIWPKQFIVLNIGFEVDSFIYVNCGAKKKSETLNNIVTFIINTKTPYLALIIL